MGASTLVKICNMKALFFLYLLFPGLWSGAQLVAGPATGSVHQLLAYSRQQPLILSFPNNQAALALTKGFAAALYGERKYGLPELGCYRLAAGFETKGGVFGLNAAYGGGAFYSERWAGLAYARSMQRVDVGIQFNVYGSGAAGYKPVTAFSAELGLLFQVRESLRAGFHLNNPGGFANAPGVRLPFIYSIGFGYEPSKLLFIGAEVKKSEDERPDLRLACQYRFHDRATASLGLQTGAASFCIGLSFWFGPVRTEFSVSLHPYLGLTPSLLLGYQKQQP